MGANIIVPHMASNSGLSRHSSATRGCTCAAAPARAASTRNAPTTNRATLSQSYCAARTRGSRKMKRRILRCCGGSDCVVDQHHRRRAVPRQHVPGGGPDQCGAGLQRIEHVLQAWRDAFIPVVAHLRLAAEAELEKMLPFDIGQHQSPRDPIEYIG